MNDIVGLTFIFSPGIIFQGRGSAFPSVMMAANDEIEATVSL